ncbi:type ISP restriction/modification enzyme [Streptomyces sp. NBC_00083]|uniref:type ISP restriction/modification enzyme n=1 Tax=Streptomyces sp. NBC_00083 TaxID=2975647 RepID=UPI00225BFADB|nr:type ISP restriction/modification enzyme [Streptomyces sp. NBC_00083]MCX5383353.1 DNA methyltransferase [Streptomyces sp. NBC_00083]
MLGVSDDLPLLDDLMPWSVAPLRLGRDWVVAPDERTLRARWDRLVRSEGAERERLFEPSRSRVLSSSVAALPGRAGATGPLAREHGACPDPVRVRCGPFDEQWLIPDQRLIDAARPELWRVADERQLFVVEQAYVPAGAKDAPSVSAVLPDGRSPAGRPGRIRPLYRRPGGLEPNLAPGLAAFLSTAYGSDVTAPDVLAWTVAAARPGPQGCAVPLPRDPGLWSTGVALGRRMTALMTRGARGGDRPRLPGGRRPYVRAALPARPRELRYDAAEEVLHVGEEGRISPVPATAWEFRAGGVRVLAWWFQRRTEPARAGTLAAVGPAGWPQEWTSDLLELITVLALLGELDAQRAELADAVTAPTTRGELRAAGVLPVPDGARRPASVLDHHEEGPGGQFALI